MNKVKQQTDGATCSARPGQFVISLDFELYWGVRHAAGVTDYFNNLIGARSAVPAILDLFSEFDIHATWATVGFLFFETTKAILAEAPSCRPNYRNAQLSPYADLPPAEAREDEKSIFFAPTLIRRIAATRNQEVATHSFSHYYCLEEGQDAETFRQDLLAAQAAAKRLDVQISSFVFPKNQCRDDYLPVCAEAGISSYRGTAAGWLYTASADNAQTWPRRLGRLLDAYVPLSGSNCSDSPEGQLGMPVNIPASRYLRPYSRVLGCLEPLRVGRIKRDLTHAAKKGLLYHLWWHPHNFGANLEANLNVLRQLLEHFRLLQGRYGIESRNMGEAARRGMAASTNGSRGFFSPRRATSSLRARRGERSETSG
jgi:hypothetical protein